MEWQDLYKACVGSIHDVESQLPRDKYLLYLSGSYGDIILNLALLKSFHEKHDKSIIVLMPSRWELLAKRFKYQFVDYILIDDAFDQRIRLSMANMGRPFLREPGLLFPLLPTLHPWLAEFNRSGRISDFELRRGLFGVKMGSKFDVPPLDEERQQQVQGLLKNLEIKKGRTICLSFLTNSNQTIPEWVQFLIYSTICERGFDCIINTAYSFPGKQLGNLVIPNNSKQIEIPCDCPFEFIEYFGGFIGVLNGITVVLGGVQTVKSHLAFTDAKQTSSLIEHFSDEDPICRTLGPDQLNQFTMIPTELGREEIVEGCNALMSRFLEA